MVCCQCPVSFRQVAPGAGRLRGLAGARPEAGQWGGALLPCPSLQSLCCQRVTAAPRPGSLKGSVHTHSSKCPGMTASDASVSLAALWSTSYPVPAGPRCSVGGQTCPEQAVVAHPWWWVTSGPAGGLPQMTLSGREVCEAKRGRFMENN